MNRFDYVAYDHLARSKQADLKEQFLALEQVVEKLLMPGRARALVLTNLEEAYMWCGKAVRDEQVQNRGAALQEDRGGEG